MDRTNDYVGDYTVYMHINKVNNKKYIGVTKKSVKERWKNGKGYSVYSPFGREVFEMGWESFDHVILNTGISKNLALTLEDFYIKYFKTENSDFGYNININGKFFKETYEELLKTNDANRHGINIDKDAFKKFAARKGVVCVKSVWNEFLRMENKPTAIQGKEIGKILTSLDYMYKSKKTKRIYGYGSCKVWVYIDNVV